MELVKVFWYSSNNFGDNANYFLVKELSGKEIVMSNRSEPHFIVCGSILMEANENSIIYGAGFANFKDELSIKPKKIISVRGHLTQQKLGVECLVGDPVLTAPLFYYPVISKKHKVGFIPHWTDVKSFNPRKHDYLINPMKPFKEVIKDILSCERIESSSLHGLILADAYNVPNRWADYGTKIGGDGFKFLDYYSTTYNPKIANENKFYVSEYKYSNLDLVRVCPFK